jgi:cell division protein YceG involved in septum cleavage
MKRVLFILFVLVLLAAGAGGWWFYTGVGRPFKGYSGTEQFVEISRGGGSLAIAKQLADAGVIRDVNSFRLALWLSGKGRRARLPIKSREAKSTFGRSRSPRG